MSAAAVIPVVITAIELGLEIIKEGKEIIEMIQKAQAEGRDLTDAELERVAALRKAAVAAWDKADGIPQD